MAIANAPSAPILTADGIPLRVSLRRSMRRSKLRALALVLPAFLFLVIVFILPIGNLLTRSVDDALINHQLPLTFSLIETWDRDQQSLPEEALFESVYLDLTTINKFLIANNTGASVDVSNAAWWLKIPPKGPYKESIVQINPRWGEAGAWQPLKQLVDKSLAHRGTEKEKRNVKQRAAFDLCSELTPLRNASCRTLFKALETWDGQSAPDESLFAALYKDLNSAQKILSGKSSTRMNYEEPGWKGIIRTSLRKFKTIEGPPYRDALIKANKGWGEVRFWQSLVLMKDARTMGYYLNAFDRRYDVDKNIILRSEERRVYVMLWWRTLILSLIVTVGCLVLSYPVAHLLATLPLRYSNLLMICVLMPFWTSLLVRIVSWMVMLQQEGVINDALVWTRLISDENRLPMMYNFTGTVIVMIQILLPFMILPIYSVMKTIPPSYMRAAQNLGAAPSLAFLRVYMPLTLPGVGAGVILVFIVAIGYYITPELVGGKDGRLIGNMIAYHMQKSLNWGLGAAMGTVLLAAILVLYWVYDKIVGVDNLKMG
ncbi:Spermidine Putrescine ABC transporter permease component PotB (TC 3.A.1.11.1) [hydrothermal vent metagenome]|uniref:Spermidine Putrescine ABC transporter permease component PotB (TC 3.A.1.11.1) n=1 Tax=hydrothermal vent metagenome TaxID=652676 RepID=A0A160TWM5_9ZZZZ|tara:strand:- start:403 stop:2031 length:1629 start_codon:yes stop_codon:yes gene_type:complete